MSDEAALLAAICAHPEEDTPRLMYADWLDEYGDPERAEFIRAECELARTDHDSPIYLPLLRRSDVLRVNNADRWFGPLRTTGDYHITTRRGFVDCVVLNAGGFAAQADLIFAHAPVVERLYVSADDDWGAFFAALRGSTVRALSFAGGVFTVDTADALAASPHAAELVELDLSYQALGPNGMAALASAPLRSLELLAANGCDIGDDGAEALFAGRSFENLRLLGLSENRMTDDACAALAGASHFDRLEELELCHNYITADGMDALAAAAHLGRLRVLNLYSNLIGPDGGRAILASRHWSGLREINLIDCGVGIEVVQDLRWVYGEQAVKA